MRLQAYEVVYQTMEKGEHSDSVFHRIVEQNDFLTRDKRFLKRLSYGTIERSVELDAILNQFAKIQVLKMTAPVRTVLRMALYEICYMEKVPEAVSCHEAVELLKKKEGQKHTAFVNGVLRTILRNGDSISLKPWESLSLPRDLYDHLCEQYGKKTTKKIGMAFLENTKDITLHIDTSKWTKKMFCEELRKAGVAVKKAYYMDDTVIISGVEDIKKIPGYEEGVFFVQDESSMLPVLCAGIRPGDKVVDVCSAPGGKAMHALLCLKGEGSLSARDKTVSKVKKIEENFGRLKFQNVSCKVWDATKSDEAFFSQADVVLCDVPCSGIGIIGRKPEIKYHALQHAKELVPIQRKIVENAEKMVKPGGVLIYSTCTVNQAENEENVRYFVEHLGLKLESLNSFLPPILCNRMTAEGMLTMIPGLQRSDGFFVARLRKTDR